MSENVFRVLQKESMRFCKVSNCLNLFKIFQKELFIRQIGLENLVQRMGFSVLAIVKN